MGSTCLNKYLGKCPQCEKDVDVNHFPNNYDCPGFIDMKQGSVPAPYLIRHFFVAEQEKGLVEKLPELVLV